MFQAPLPGAPLGPPRGPLEVFVERAAEAKGSELLRVIGQALLHPEVFVYGELLALENISDLARPNDDHGPQEKPGALAVKLLRMMASGTVEDLVDLIKRKEAKPVPPILLLKLRLLTITSRAAVSSRLFFKDLQKALEAPGCCDSSEGALFGGSFQGPPEGCTTACGSKETAAKTAKAALDAEETEELVLETLRLGLVRGRVDGELGCLDIWGSMSRDPTDRDIKAMISVLNDFDQRITDTLHHCHQAAEALQQQVL